MTTLEVGQKLVDLCKAGKNAEAMQTLYAENIVSVEAGAPPGGSAQVDGLANCLTKSKNWAEAHEIHGAVIDGPYPHGDRFAVMFDYDITNRASNQRFHLKEVALYAVANGKIVREEFFYRMG